MRSRGFESDKHLAAAVNFSGDLINRLWTGEWSNSPKQLAWQYRLDLLAKRTGVSIGELICAARETRWAGWVYLMHDRDQSKIGRSRKPKQRFLALKSQRRALVFVHQIATNDALRLEQNLHRLYAIYRIHGEWFALPDDEIQQFRSVSSYQFKPSIYAGAADDMTDQ